MSKSAALINHSVEQWRSAVTVIDELKGKMEREGLSVYYVAKALGTNWHTVRDWLVGKRKPQGLSQRAIRQFLES